MRIENLVEIITKNISWAYLHFLLIPLGLQDPPNHAVLFDLIALLEAMLMGPSNTVPLSISSVTINSLYRVELLRQRGHLLAH